MGLLLKREGDPFCFVLFSQFMKIRSVWKEVGR